MSRAKGAPTEKHAAFDPGNVCFVIHAGDDEALAPSAAEASVDGRPLVRPSDFNGERWTKTVNLGDLGAGPHQLNAVIASKPTSRFTIEVRRASSAPANAVGAIVPDEVIVNLTQAASANYALTPGSIIVLGGQALRAVRQLPLGPWSMQLSGVPPVNEAEATARTLQAIAAIKGDGNVEYAQANFILKWSAVPADPLFVPADPLFVRQWHYDQIGLPQAWDTTTGRSSARIAVIDSGSVMHPDLIEGFGPGCNFSNLNALDSDPTDNGTFSDGILNVYRHGTAVMGIAGARMNDEGGTGVCPGCTIIPIRVNNLTDDRVAFALDWAANHARAGVINMSFNVDPDRPAPTCDDHPAVRDAINAISGRVVIVASAGNFGANAANNAPTFPADCPGVLAVAASQRDGSLAPYSSRGPAVDITAPGGGLNTHPNPELQFFGEALDCSDDPNVWDPYLGQEGIVTTWAVGRRVPEGRDFCHRYFSGTSFAAPHVSGVVGLMLSVNPSLSPAAVEEILEDTARDNVGNCPVGACGSGLVDANRAVQRARDLLGPAVIPTTGAWWNPSRSGNGLDLQRLPSGEYVAIWITYRTDGTPIWYVSGSAPIIGSKWEAPLYESQWDYATETQALTEIGTVGLTLTDSDHGAFEWSINPAAGTTACIAATNHGEEPFEVYPFGGTAENGPASGHWYPTGQTGWGASISQHGPVVVITLALYDSAGEPTWVQGVENGSTDSMRFNSMIQFYNGTSLCPGCTGNRLREFREVGSAALVTLSNIGSSIGQLAVDVDYVATSGGWHRAVSIQRLAGP